MKPASFPFSDRPRLWCVAVSHYQVEGDDPCDWTAWEAAGRTRGGACGPAVRAWERYEADAELAASVGANAFRFSVSWSRVEPKPGEFDPAALERDRRFAEHLAALCLEPVVTLLHYTHPVWFHRDTPWTSPRSVEAFARFSRVVARWLGHVVRLWTVLNEPLVLLLGGFIDGQIPPGLAGATDARRGTTSAPTPPPSTPRSRAGSPSTAFSTGPSRTTTNGSTATARSSTSSRSTADPSNDVPARRPKSSRNSGKPS